MRLLRSAPLVFASLAATLIALPPGAAAPAAKPAADFTLTDAAGKPWTAAGQKAKAVVVAFLATDCPMSNGYMPALNDVAVKFAGKGVRVVGVFPDPDTTAEQVAAHAKEYKVAFPLMRDPTHKSVAVLHPKVTPEVVVLDDALAVRYRGRIDDGFVGRLKPRAMVTRRDLAVALDEVLAGKPVSVAETKAFGCPIPDPAKSDVAAEVPVTFHKDVQPVLQAHCQSCHRPGQVGPFALTNFKQAVKWAGTSLEEIHGKRMPPWKPEKNPLLTGERTLPADAVKVLERWVAQGMPEGDPKDAPPPAKFVDGWTLGEPDLILESPEVTVGADGRDLFRVLVFPTNLPEDKAIVAVEVKPGNPRVVHHTLQVIDSTGAGRKLLADAQAKAKPDAADRGPGYVVSMGWGFTPNPAHLLGGWAPGMLPKRLPDGIGQTLPKGADICMQVHYHRTGKEEKDRTKIGLYFAGTPIKEAYRSIPVAGLFQELPAGDKAHKVETAWRLTEDVTAYRVVPHMHLLGKDIELTVTPPDGKETTLIRIPEWDYNWQEQYELKTPLKLPKGTLLRVRATFDNSADNPRNPNAPPKPVKFGEQTTDEMCFVFLGVSTPSTTRRLIMPVGGFFGK